MPAKDRDSSFQPTRSLRRNDDADEFDLYVLRRAGDLAPWERERMQLVLAARG